MNRNIAMMLLEAREDRERMKRIENKMNAQPTYATANSQPHMYTSGMVPNQVHLQGTTHHTQLRDNPSLRTMRSDPYIWKVL
jgi:hypothetical protein